MPELMKSPNMGADSPETERLEPLALPSVRTYQEVVEAMEQIMKVAQYVRLGIIRRGEYGGSEETESSEKPPLKTKELVEMARPSRPYFRPIAKVVCLDEENAEVTDEEAGRRIHFQTAPGNRADREALPALQSVARSLPDVHEDGESSEKEVGQIRHARMIVYIGVVSVALSAVLIPGWYLDHLLFGGGLLLACAVANVLVCLMPNTFFSLVKWCAEMRRRDKWGRNRRRGTSAEKTKV